MSLQAFLKLHPAFIYFLPAGLNLFDPLYIVRYSDDFKSFELGYRSDEWFLRNSDVG